MLGTFVDREFEYCQYGSPDLELIRTILTYPGTVEEPLIRLLKLTTWRQEVQRLRKEELVVS